MPAVGKYMGERPFLNQMIEKMRQQSRGAAMVKKQQLRYDFSEKAVTTKHITGWLQLPGVQMSLTCSAQFRNRLGRAVSRPRHPEYAPGHSKSGPPPYCQRGMRSL